LQAQRTFCAVVTTATATTTTRKSTRSHIYLWW